MKKFNSFGWKIVVIGFIVLSSMVWGAVIKPVSVVKLSENSSQTDLSLCATLNKYLYSSDGVAAKPYIKLIPNQPFTVELSYNGICLKGLKPRTKYQVSINRNIPLGEFKLDRDYTLSGTTTDFEPSLDFKDGGYILPAKGEISIPIETINVHELAISLYRINTKNLIGKINDYGLIRELYSHSIEKIASTEGYFLWQKRLKIRSDLNRAKTTAIPVGDFLKERKPGVYILQAQEVGSDGELANAYSAKTQWFMVSDIGIYTLRGDDGLYLYTKKLSNAENYNQVKLELISRNNELLDSVVSKEGKAFFPGKVLNGKRGLKPKAIYAYGANDDFSIIDLSKPSHDLSDRGVQGRDNPGKYDAYVYSNRGIFRPGETVPIEILLRNHLGEAEGGQHLSLKLFDSRQVEVLTKLLTTDALGHAQTTLAISQSGSRGKWYLKLYAGDIEAVGGISFLVEDFVPPKIKVDVTNSAIVLKPKVKSQLEVSAHYLSGEVLPQATVEVVTILHHAKKPFKLYEAYQFGDMRERVGNLFLSTFDGKTDLKGEVTIPFAIDNIPKTTLPLSAHITVSVGEPGGRPVEKVIDRFLEDKAGYIGIKANFENASVDMGSHPIFDLLYLQASHLKSTALSYRVVKEEVHWNWRSGGDDWTYHKTYSDAEEVAKGSLESSGSEPVALTLPKLDWGSYRLEVTDQGNAKILSTYRFGSGYEESMSKASPDRLPVAIDKHDYNVGEEVKVHITPKFSGPVIVSVANHTILDSKTIQARAGEEQEVTFIVQKNWGSSTYILATAFRAQSKKLGANRAIGLAHIAIVDPEKVINLSVEHPAKVSSSESVKIKVVAKEMAGKSAFVTLGAVDEGVLRLTNYQVPDPVAYFYGQQKLGMKIRDIYGDLIEAKGGHAQFNVGAGDMISEELQEKPVANKRKVVALFSGAVAFDREGRAEIVLDIPDYQGSLKVMAVAWSDKAVGAKSSDLVVKDMISPEIYMPKFISVGDQAMGRLSIAFDKNAAAGSYTIRLTNRSDDGVIDSKVFAFPFEGQKLGRFTTPVLLRAPSLQDLRLDVEVLYEGKVLAQKEWELAVRSRYPEVTIRKVGLLAKGSLFDSQTLFDGTVWSKPHQISLKLSGKPLFATASLTDELINYWGRCAEQTTSRAMPWLFMPETSELSQKINIQAIIPQAIEQLLLYQKLDGGFGLWSGSKTEMWISAYALDFLTRAQKSGYAVPSCTIKSGLDWIENNLDRWSSDAGKQEADAYGLYVLAYSGRTLMSEILFRAKDPKSKIQSAQAWGQLAAALAYVGEKALAEKLFEKATGSLGQSKSSRYFANYGGVLRDEAALLLLMQESALGLDWQGRYAELASQAKTRQYLSTQEMSLLLRVVFASDVKTAKLKLFADGEILSLKNAEYSIGVKDLHQLPVITNESSGQCWYSLNYKATPSSKAYAQIPNNGFTIQKKFYTMNGVETDLSSVKQNDRLIVVIEGEIERSHRGDPLVTDWIPAGFELENPHLNGVDPTSGLGWLGEQSVTDHVEYRNDRYVAALSAASVQRHFKVAYVLRAVTVGSYTLPPAKIEDMYRPYYRALSKLHTDQLSIKEVRQSAKTASASSAQNNTTPTQKLTAEDFDAVYTRRVKKLDRYSITQLNFLRNSIFARAGFDFAKSNPMLYQKFSNYSWYHPAQKSSSAIYKEFTALQKENVQKLLDEEKFRGGSLVLADFYRVRIKLLSDDDLKKYSKQQLFILRNSLFARHGVSFKNRELKQIFSYMPWYHPSDVTSAIVFDEQMSEQEKANVKLMQQMEKR